MNKLFKLFTECANDELARGQPSIQTILGVCEVLKEMGVHDVGEVFEHYGKWSVNKNKSFWFDSDHEHLPKYEYYDVDHIYRGDKTCLITFYNTWSEYDIYMSVLVLKENEMSGPPEVEEEVEEEIEEKTCPYPQLDDQ